MAENHSLHVKFVDTGGLRTAYLEAGNPLHPTVILVHGNVSSNLFWNHTLGVLCERFHVLAPDLRGYGQTEPRPIDARRGVRDWADDLRQFVLALGIAHPVHWVGWSMGGGVIMQYAIDHAADVPSLTLINPLPPFGFGGTKDAAGTPTYADFAGSGGGKPFHAKNRGRRRTAPIFAQAVNAGH